MAQYETDEEQLEKLKEWWKNYGKTMLIAIVIAALASFGWRYWQGYKMKVGQRASELYEQILIAQSENQPKKMNAFATALYKHYNHTSYAKLGQLMEAKLDVKSGKLSDAEQKLLWVMQESRSKQIRQIARLRVARVMTAEKKYNDALKILNKVDSKTFSGAVAEVKGDIYAAQNKTTLARDSYNLALKTLPKDNGNYALVQMKLADLA